MNNPLSRERDAKNDAQTGIVLHEAMLAGQAERCFELCLGLIRGDFDELERLAVPGERELRKQLHEIIDSALRDLLLAEGSASDAWRRLTMPDEFGLFECALLASNARWLRLCGSPLVDEGLEPLDLEELAEQGLAEQARRLARFCLVNDGATEVDYAALRKALDPRLHPFLQDWIATVHFASPSRIDDSPAASHQDATMAALLAARRHHKQPLPSSSSQSGPAFRTPYFSGANTRDLSVEFNGRQMTSLMESFYPDEVNCNELADSTLDIQALAELPDSEDLIVCPNWHSEHVIFRCMSPLVENMRKRKTPLLRVHTMAEQLPLVDPTWQANTCDVAHSEQLALAHLGAIHRELVGRKIDFAFYPEIVPANSSSWMATQRFARVQATGYGFPVTTGLASIDYFIGGADVERADAGDDYSEQLVLLPGMGVSTTAPPLASRDRERPVDVRPTAGDPLRIVTTTSHQKLNRELLSTWNAILAAHPEAHLDLFTNMTAAQVQVHEPALARLLAGGDVTLHTSQPRQTILDTLQEADLYLDAFPYGGFNSLVEPLSFGCPVVTIEGDRARNRLGAALLRRAGLGDSVIAHSFGEYAEIVSRLITDAPERLALRARIGPREGLLQRLADPDLAEHMDAAVAWMRKQGPRKRSERRAPILISA